MHRLADPAIARVQLGELPVGAGEPPVEVSGKVVETTHGGTLLLHIEFCIVDISVHSAEVKARVGGYHPHRDRRLP